MPFCTALRRRIVPANLLLQQNDRLLRVGGSEIDARGEGHVTLENLVDQAVRNDGALDRLLSGASFGKRGNAQDDVALAQLRHGLQRMRVLQNQMLNVEYGIPETQQMNDSITSTAGSTASPNGAPIRAPLHTFGDPPGFVSAESRYKSVWGVDPRLLAAFRLLGEDRTELHKLEASLTPAITKLQRECGG